MNGQLQAPIGLIGRFTPEKLAEYYQSELMGRLIPNMEKFVVDHRRGGFMCEFDIATKVRLSTDKRAWYEGRGIWFYSFLYNRLEADDRHLGIAAQSKDFILPYIPEDKGFFPASFTREGQVISGQGDIFGNLYIAEGLLEYGRAAAEPAYRAMGKDLLRKSLAICLEDGYRYAPFKEVAGGRFLNHWMVMLWTASQALADEADPVMKEIADQCIDEALHRHLHAESGLLTDIWVPNRKAIADRQLESCNFGLSVQLLWMVMYEAERRQDPELFMRAARLFKHHITVAKDEVYGGYLGYLTHIDGQQWRTDKILGLHEEILIGALFLVEHLNDDWAKQCADETFAYVRRHFVRQDYAFWISSGDRKLAAANTRRVEFYHHSRHLMLGLLSLRRIIKRKGQVSGFVADTGI